VSGADRVDPLPAGQCRVPSEGHRLRHARMAPQTGSFTRSTRERGEVALGIGEVDTDRASSARAKTWDPETPDPPCVDSLSPVGDTQPRPLGQGGERHIGIAAEIRIRWGSHGSHHAAPSGRDLRYPDIEKTPAGRERAFCLRPAEVLPNALDVARGESGKVRSF
jgi:hypothetical protein